MPICDPTKLGRGASSSESSRSLRRGRPSSTGIRQNGKSRSSVDMTLARHHTSQIATALTFTSRIQSFILTSRALRSRVLRVSLKQHKIKLSRSVRSRKSRLSLRKSLLKKRLRLENVATSIETRMRRNRSNSFTLARTMFSSVSLLSSVSDASPRMIRSWITLRLFLISPRCHSFLSEPSEQLQLTRSR